MNRWKLVTSAALLAGVASAADPAKMQDPPGNVGVDQPAGVSAPERNTEQDATDTLQGGGRTDVISGKRAAGRPSGPQIRPGQGRATVEPGVETRASFGGTGSGATSGSASSAPRDESSATGSDAESTSLGTDLGYGTATEAIPPSR